MTGLLLVCVLGCVAVVGSAAAPADATVVETDEYEPNDDRENATVIGPNETLSGLSVSPDNPDYFVVSLGPNERLTLNVTAEGETDGGLVDFENATGRQFDGTTIGSDEGIVTSAPEETRYYVKVWKHFEEAPTTYSISTNVTRLPADDRFEQNDDIENATPIDAGSNLSDLRFFHDDPDYYAVNLTRGEQLVATVDAEHDWEYPRVRGYGPSGSEITDAYPVEDGRRLLVTADVNGTYYLSAKHADDATVRSYSLRTTVRDAPADDAYEPNDNWNSAVPIEPGTNLPNLSLIPGDTDTYAVNLTRGERFSVRYVNNSTGDSIAIDVDGRESYVTDNSPQDASHLYSFTAPETDQYLIALSQAHCTLDEFDTTRYSLQTSVEPPLENDEYEPNDARENATALQSNQTLHNLRVTPLDTDYFAVDLTVDEELYVRVEQNVTDETILSSVYGPEKVHEPLRVSTGNGSALVFQPQHNGTHFVRVDYPEGFNDAVAIPYTLSSSVRPFEPTDEYEPNDDSVNATPLASNQTVRNLAIAPPDSDYFAVNLTADEKWHVRFEQNVTDTNLVSYIRGPNSYHTPATVSTENGSAFVFYPRTTGTHYVGVYYPGRLDDRAASPFTPVIPYTLSSSVRPFELTDQVELRGDAENATTLRPGTRLTDLQVAGNGRDVYRVEVPDNGTVRIDTQFRNRTTARTALYDESGQRLEQRQLYSRTDFTHERQALDAGTYYVVVENWQLTPSRYTLTTNVTAPEEGQVIWVSPRNVTTGLGTEQRFEVLMTAPRGHQVQIFDLSLTNGTVGDITNGTFPTTPTIGSLDIAPSNDTVNVEGSYFDARNASSRLLLATVTVEATATGSTDIQLRGVEVSDEDNRQYEFRGAADATLSVVERSARTLDGQPSPAKSLDGDSLLEDVDGDGEGNIFDVLTYYNNRKSDVVTSNPTQFDFDGDGTAGTLFDALALYNELS